MFQSARNVYLIKSLRHRQPCRNTAVIEGVKRTQSEYTSVIQGQVYAPRSVNLKI